MKFGYAKIPINVGITNKKPKIYQGYLLPHDVWILSLETPTIGVVIPSAIYPDKRHKPVMVGSSLTTLLRYHVKYTNHILAHKSLLKWPTEYAQRCLFYSPSLFISSRFIILSSVL
jgi:hypothetical protein